MIMPTIKAHSLQVSSLHRTVVVFVVSGYLSEYVVHRSLARQSRREPIACTYAARAKEGRHTERQKPAARSEKAEETWVVPLRRRSESGTNKWQTTTCTDYADLASYKCFVDSPQKTYIDRDVPAYSASKLSRKLSRSLARKKS